MPEASGSRFRYRYAALLRKQEWDSQTLSAELTQLRQVIRTHEAQHETMEGEAAECTQLIREAMNGIMTGVERTRREILDTYIGMLENKLAEQAAMIGRLKNMENEVSDQLTESRKTEEILTRLREQEQHLFQVDVTRKQYRDLDDAWLSHTGTQGDKV